MNRCSAIVAPVILSIGMAASQSNDPHAAGAFHTGAYRNLLTLELGIPEAAVRARIDSAFRQLFYGDDQNERLYYPVGDDMAYIEDIPNADVRTEGMSYGMMVAVQLDKKEEFDRLWKWTKMYMYMSAGPHRGYFAWHCRPDGRVIDSTAASDGEEWFVTALYFASARWGDGEGIFAYRTEAEHILNTMLHKEDEPAHGNVTNMFDAKEKLVRFVPDVRANHFTDPSYQLPHYCELWSQWAPEDNEFWKKAAAAGRRLLRIAANPHTGLSPDYSTFGGQPEQSRGGSHAAFRFDAWRVAMNVALDWMWFADDPWDVEQSNRLLKFFASQGIKEYGNQYTLDGKQQLGNDHSAGLVAALAVAATAATDPIRVQFLNELWLTPIPHGRYRYYDGMLYLLGLLQVSGNFRIFAPGASVRGTADHDGTGWIEFENDGKSFPLSSSGTSAPLCVTASDYPGVIRVVHLFQKDVSSVSGVKPDVVLDRVPSARSIVLIGTLGKNPLIDSLVHTKAVDVSGIVGKWEAYVVQTVDHPFPGVERALVIAGSDKRGTMYGMLDLSKEMGVSPWYWWADVAIKHHDGIFVTPGRHADGPPSVKYRGIFLNDEDPDLTRWIRAKYGEVPISAWPPIRAGVANYGHVFYERIFELLLRLRANYLWPAMWNNAFNEDDPQNPKLADEYGIVMGTSHQEPMLRAQKEWDRRYKQTLGSWNYAKYPDTLQTFWREGIRRNREYESIVTIGLRGADDTPMAPGGPEENMALLEKIIGVQRKILSEEVNTDITKVPQVWCLYKEVLEFYNAGMRVPDDVTLLWPDDNWGNVRRLPTAAERRRAGGAGIYYHFDYHGGPRNYQWLNTNPLPKIWEQMSLAKAYGADRIWIVNVGHFKGYELPMEYFMDLAWNTGRWTNDNIGEYTRRWAERQFDGNYAREIADILSKYTKYNGRRKPELLSPTTYSIVNHREADHVVEEFQAITQRAEEISEKLPAEERNAFYELVLFPTKASALVNELYVDAGKNALYAKQGRASTNRMADEVRRLFSADTSLMGYFNHTFAGGKWDHFMDQTHLGYTSWNDPPENSLRAVPLKEIALPARAELGVAVEGSDAAWPGAPENPALPPFDKFNRQTGRIEVFNRGSAAFEYAAHADRGWITLSAPNGRVEQEARIDVGIDWGKAPRKDARGTVTVAGAGEKVTIEVKLASVPGFAEKGASSFLESDGYVSMEAEHYARKSEFGERRWIRVEEYGHTLSAMRANAPPDATPATPGKDAPCLHYDMFLADTGTVSVSGTFSASLNFVPGRPLRYAVSFDNESPQVITLVRADFIAQHGNMEWEKTVSDNFRTGLSRHHVASYGTHTLNIWMVDPGVVLQKLVVDAGGLKPSYLGPPESYRRMP